MNFTFFHGVLCMKQKGQCLYTQINHVSNNINSLNDLDKAKWLLMQEDQNILVALGTYIHIYFEKRKKNVKLISV